MKDHLNRSRESDLGLKEERNRGLKMEMGFSGIKKGRDGGGELGVLGVADVPKLENCENFQGFNRIKLALALGTSFLVIVSFFFFGFFR